MKQIKIADLKKRLTTVLKEVHNEAVAYEVISEGLVIARISEEIKASPTASRPPRSTQHLRRAA